jgi:C-terminal processing protease CtpA/Prc
MQLDQADSLAKYVDDVEKNTAWSDAIDTATLKKTERAAILQGDGSDATFYGAMHRAHLAFREGHQSLFASSCKKQAMYSANSSRLGVCGRARGNDVVVTYAQAGNPMGLKAGDRVIAAGMDAGPGLLDAALQRPFCGALPVTDVGRRDWAATSFFGTVPPGMTLSIAPADGSAPHDVVVPDTDSPTLDCQDPLGRDIKFNAQSSVRPDGVAVIRLPRFYPNNAVLPQNPTQADIDKFIADFQGEIQAEFDKVKSAPAIIWDARSNYGGLTLVGLAIAAGMPTAKTTHISYCNTRIPGSNPPKFSAFKYAVYDINPGGPFAYTGKTAIVTDALDYSAADYFPLAVRKATSTPIVGTPSAGAFGGPGAFIALKGPPKMQYDYDINRCVDADTNAPLEGKPVMPDVMVEYDPLDLDKGIDTVLEAAVALVK